MKKKPTLAEFRKLWEPRTRGGYKYRIHAIDLVGGLILATYFDGQWDFLIYRRSGERLLYTGLVCHTLVDLPRKKRGKK